MLNFQKESQAPLLQIIMLKNDNQYKSQFILTFSHYNKYTLYLVVFCLFKLCKSFSHARPCKTINTRLNRQIEAF